MRALLLEPPVTPVVIVHVVESSTRETTIYDLLVGSFGLVGVILLGAVLFGLLLGGLFIGLRVLRPNNAFNGERQQPELRVTPG